MHAAFADPYCPRGRAAATAGAQPCIQVTDGGTLVVINGPRFSTASRVDRLPAQQLVDHRDDGMPEASLARELALCYTCLALVTDHDAGVEPAPA